MDPCNDDGVYQLTLEEKKYAVTYLNETDENRVNAIVEIRNWILENDDLCARTDDFFILRFLRACKFNIEKTKLKVRNYHQQRTDLPEWFATKDPFLPEMQAMLDLGVFLPLRELDNYGRMVILIRPFLYNPYKQKLSDLIKACMMIMDAMVKDHVSVSLRGVVAVADFDGLTFGHTLQCRPNILKHAIHSWQGCYPIRIKSIILINVTTSMDIFFTICKQLMNAKLKQRLNVYKRGTENDWCKEISNNIFPIEYGGTDCTIQELTERVKRKVEENRDWIVDDEKYKVIQSVK